VKPCHDQSCRDQHVRSYPNRHVRSYADSTQRLDCRAAHDQVVGVGQLDGQGGLGNQYGHRPPSVLDRGRRVARRP
jgi:hypothetical protein